MIALEAAAERQKRQVRRDQILAFNIANLAGAAFVGKLKPFDECFPPPVEEDKAGMTKEGAAVLNALFKLKSSGLPMTVEKVSLH